MLSAGIVGRASGQLQILPRLDVAPANDGLVTADSGKDMVGQMSG